MSGVKGRSGRRPRGIELRRLDTIQRAWDLTHEFFLNPDIALIDKQKVATQLVVKDITLKQEVSGDALNKIIIAYAKPDSGRLDYVNSSSIKENTLDGKLP